jgi:hypothetical protein
LNKLEHQMQMANVKLSVARNENTALKAKVIGLRREKFLHLQISHDLVGSSFLTSPFVPSLLYLRSHHYDILYAIFSLIGGLTSSRCALFYCAATRGVGGPQESEAVPEGDYQHQ